MRAHHLTVLRLRLFETLQDASPAFIKGALLPVPLTSTRCMPKAIHRKRPFAPTNGQLTESDISWRLMVRKAHEQLILMRIADPYQKPTQAVRKVNHSRDSHRSDTWSRTLLARPLTTRNPSLEYADVRSAS
jgi:hypothetical protein